MGDDAPIPAEGSDISALLKDWTSREPAARDRVVTVLYEELRRLARLHLNRERPDHTLQPTALVNEVYLRLDTLERMQWRDRTHFLAMISLNGSGPGPGLKLCVVGLDRSQREDARLYTWCMDLEAIKGSFHLLLPAGEGRGSVCLAAVVAERGQCETLTRQGNPVPNAPPPLARFDFRVEAGTTRGITLR